MTALDGRHLFADAQRPTAIIVSSMYLSMQASTHSVVTGVGHAITHCQHNDGKAVVSKRVRETENDRETGYGDRCGWCGDRDQG